MEDVARSQGLAEDVRRYGAWMRDEAFKRIGHLYPPVEITAEMARTGPTSSPYVGQKLTVIAWLWARTVKSPSPAFSHVTCPSCRALYWRQKEGKEAWVEPVVTGDSYRFVVRTGMPPEHAKEGTKASGRGAEFRCVLSGAAIGGDYIKEEAKAGRMGQRLMAIVCEGERQRIYVSPMQAERFVSTDPPYYDNIGYADLSDFFYVWLRRSLRSSVPDLFAHRRPKAEELVATRIGTDQRRRPNVLPDGMTEAMRQLATQRTLRRRSRSTTPSSSLRPKRRLRHQPAGRRSLRRCCEQD
jgi:adenine-specific DNA methylase